MCRRCRPAPPEHARSWRAIPTIANPSARSSDKSLTSNDGGRALQTEYQENQDQLKNAQLGQAAEAGKNAEHFVLLQSPYPDSQPYSPNRIGVILLGLVLGCALAGAAVAIAENADATVRGSRDLIGLNGLPCWPTSLKLN